MKLQIAIVTRKLITGGVERALIAMLRHIPYDRVQVDLYVESNGGELFHELPAEVHVEELATVHPKDARRHPLAVAGKAFCMARLHCGKPPFIRQCRLQSWMYLPTKKRYDLAISYHAPNTAPVFYVIDRMRADRKVLWLHGDLETNAGLTPLAMRYHSRYDWVFAVSADALDSFLRVHPDFEGRVSLFHNFVDADGIRAKAACGPTFDDGFAGFRILSVGRLSPQKGFDIAVRVCERLRERIGDSFRWYLCGEGEQRVELERMIDEAGLSERIVLLGNRENPYGYMRNCDLYVQPSRYEGYCTTTNEARLFAKPVITTDVSGAREQFEDGVTGWIVPIDADEIAEKVAWCIAHPAQMRETASRLRDRARFAEDDVSSLLSLCAPTKLGIVSGKEDCNDKDRDRNKKIGPGGGRACVDRNAATHRLQSIPGGSLRRAA